MKKTDIAGVLGFRLAEPDEKVWGVGEMLAEQIAEHGPHTYWVGLAGPSDFDWIWLRDAMTDQQFINAMTFDPQMGATPLPEQLKPILFAWPPTLDGVELRSAPGEGSMGASTSRVTPERRAISGHQTTPGRVTLTIRDTT